MDSETYNELLRKVSPFIKKQDTIMRDAISPNERLSATLRFLASGQTFEDLKFLTAISPQSLGVLIMETCSAIIKVLKPYIKLPATEDEWKAVATEFGDRWNFPNCIGALDGKHVQIKKPNCSWSYYFNYKKTFSIVLLALVSANYEFLMVEAGANGRVSDAEGKCLQNNKNNGNFVQLPIPQLKLSFLKCKP
ncbi:unnamed protein product [Hermetia illucens]|uniref:DDE Tnp4 domain-containing protein n=1 Tax=Hermetia illucens TaxID=343691 RepID=A0A7R8UC93_HERIL|nr:unnamed protein product [Hermetia illucens]